MNKILVFLVVLVGFSTLTSCDKDVQINAEYKEISIVYGLLDPWDSISYLRIEKAFLSDGDIFQAAQVADSNIYPYKLDVKILNQNNDVVVTFDTTTVYNKKEGIFYAPKMTVYYAVTKGLFNAEDTYKLEINNPKSGSQITSSTKLINGHALNISKPNYKISFEGNHAIEFKSVKDIRLYQTNIRFYYIEEDVITGDSTSHYIDWVQAPVTSQFISGGEDMDVQYSGDAFFANLRNNIPVKENIIRREGPVMIIVSMADETFNIYMDINKPSASLVIDRPAFTNIENGFGIFASRSQQEKSSKMNSSSHRILMEMEDLNFRESNN